VHPRLVQQPDRRRRPGRSSRDQGVIPDVLDAASQTQYRDNAVLVTMKILEAAGLLTPDLPLASL
jgi:hypothetical protein